MSISLTVNEIIDLAKFAGLSLNEDRLPDIDEAEMMITIKSCPSDGLMDESENELQFFRMCAFITEYPEEGYVGLGPLLNK